MTANPNLKTRLELTWVGKDQRPRLEPRILIEEKSLSYRAPAPVALPPDAAGPAPTFDNLLIHGDNLLALKALEQQYAGKVKCVFIDPPYNTGSAFTHYDDGVEHSLWLSLMRDRLEILRTLLSEDGSIWITIDDNEAHYLKVLCDEVFGRSNFVSSIAWQKVFAKKNKALISGSHDHIFVIARNVLQWRRNLLPRNAAGQRAFRNVDGDPRGPWQSVAYSVQSEDAERRSAYRYKIALPSGREVLPPQGRHWNGLPDRTKLLREDQRLWFGVDGNNPPRIKVFLSEVQDGVVPDTWWTHEFAGSNQDSKREMLDLFPDIEPFGTPKPETLLSRILQVATNPNDLVLDSFAGSGTTGAVAQKMGRRWIMVELGEHCRTHIVPRLRKVIDGTDPGGVTPSIGWRGGGGYRYLNLAPSLLKRDAWGHWVINPAYDAEMLAEAMCKHMGFVYAPSAEVYWQHGRSSERDHIYVTTGSLTHDQLRGLSLEVGDERTLLICCKAFMADASAFANLSVKKIPQAVLAKCEWDAQEDRLRLPVGDAADTAADR